VSPAHHTREHRWRVLVAVLVLLVGVGIAAGTRGGTSAAPPTQTSLVSPPDAESSASYCTGQTSSAGAAPGTVILTNTTTKPATGIVSEVTDTGAAVQAAVVVPAGAAAVPSLPAPPSGAWVSQIVTVSGGGVAVTQAVHGSLGWSESPCQSTTSSAWYFAVGSTAGSNGLYVSLLNPTSTPVVVDLSFVVPTGTVHPINYQGIVLQPGQLQVEDVSAEVQNQPWVSTVATTRTGRMVASELQLLPGSSAGLAIVPGSARRQADWAVPLAQELQDGQSELSIFNPGPTPADVSVRFRIPSGALAPLTDRVAPGTTWVIATSSQTRIPQGVGYSATVTSSGGEGVIVGRVVRGPGSTTAPQAGAANGVGAIDAGSPTGLWVVPPPGAPGSPIASGATPEHLAFVNTSSDVVHYLAYAVGPGGRARTVASGTLAPGESADASGSALNEAALDPIIVRASGPMAISEDVGPTGNVGVVTMPALPLAAPIGL
jgi:hypothetical protein